MEGTGGEATDFIWEEGHMSNWKVSHKTLSCYLHLSRLYVLVKPLVYSVLLG